jgi:hypothetical protein
MHAVRAAAGRTHSDRKRRMRALANACTCARVFARKKGALEHARSRMHTYTRKNDPAHTQTAHTHARHRAAPHARTRSVWSTSAYDWRYSSTSAENEPNLSGLNASVSRRDSPSCLARARARASQSQTLHASARVRMRTAPHLPRWHTVSTMCAKR